MPYFNDNSGHMQRLFRGGRLRFRLANIFWGRDFGQWVSRLGVTRIVCFLESDGESRFCDSTDSVSLLRGRWVLVPAFHEITHFQNPSLKHLSIHCSLELFSENDVLSHLPRMFYRDDADFVDGIRPWIENGSEFRVAAGVQNVCWHVLGTVLDETEDFIETIISGYSRYEKLMNFLRDQSRAGITLEEMARTMHLTPESFSKQFKRDTGLAPMRYYHRQLAGQASHKLLECRSVKATATALNFSNEFYFSRFFHREMSMSPREYLRRYSF